MQIKTFQDILPLIEQPSRYLGTETNAIIKNKDKIKLHIALAFPDLYEIGTSHLGIQILYHILNENEKIYAERVFAPAIDMERYLKSSKLPIISLESKSPLNKFDIIGFSLLYELNFTNILTILELSNIPFYSSQRDLSFPFIIAGGPCTCNPEPVSEFFDAMVIGDGENVVVEISKAYLNWKENNVKDKDLLLKEWSKIEGVYIPSYFEAGKTKIKRAIVSNLDTSPFPDAPIIAYGKSVHDRLRLEVSRGCTRGCRFCQASMIYRPVRERSIENLTEITKRAILKTGYEDLSLLSLSVGDYSCLVPLMETLMDRYSKEHISISFPSIRAETLTPNLMNLIKKVRKTGFTIAPEAGSQKLRNIINKNITDEEIINTIKNAFDMGWKVIKLYFMIGLPYETDEDLISMIDFIKNLKQIKGIKGRGQINVSITTFIPKPHTPFQWIPQISLEQSKDKINWLRNSLKISGVDFKFQKPEASVLEGLFARGDKKLSRLLVSAHQKGCRFDGWSDLFRYKLWEEAINDEKIDVDFYIGREISLIETLPWDHIDIKVSKDYLIKELEKAKKGESTIDCRNGDCSACGVCDFENIKPVIFESSTVNLIPLYEKQNLPIYKKLKISYSKTGDAKYFGHLELVNIFIRAIKRSCIPIKFSEGFHPMPKIYFDDPLPIGTESLFESFYIHAAENISFEYIKSSLNENIPQGLLIKECKLAGSEKTEKNSITYLITIKDDFFDEKKLELYNNEETVIITRINQKGKSKSINLKEAVSDIKILDKYNLKVTLKNVRPPEVVQAIFKINAFDIKQGKILKCNEC
ncbi:MAG: TIGR03960 family B12-binding radical SAM protein [Desulfobacterales bacterium]|nr:TIGR03960 family B12-binding radical SAM protein [Desulfobacterales bacterium]